MRPLLLPPALLAFLALFACAHDAGEGTARIRDNRSEIPAASAPPEVPNTSSPIATPLPLPARSVPAVRLPARVQLTVPFTVQAPTANWDAPYQEACEEASLLMVHAFLQGNDLTAQDAERDLQALIAWERRNGYGEDVTIAELAEIAQRYYGYRARVETEVTVPRIKELLMQGHPVIVPAAGRDLRNPFFSGEGPWYHMLVITGYGPRFFVTNDPGTRRGEGYRYDHATLLSAVHDWTGVKEDIRSGQKVMLVVSTSSTEKP